MPQAKLPEHNIRIDTSDGRAYYSEAFLKISDRQGVDQAGRVVSRILAGWVDNGCVGQQKIEVRYECRE